MPVAVLAGLAFVAEAIVAIVIVLAIAAIVYLVQRFVGKIPLIGNWLVANISNIILDVSRSLASYYDRMMGAMQQLVNAGVAFVTAVPERILITSIATYYTIQWIVLNKIPNVVAGVVSYAGSVATAALRYADAKFSDAISYAGAVATAALRYADGLFNRAMSAIAVAAAQLVSYADSLYLQAIAFAASEATAVRNFALGLAQQLANDIIRLQALAVSLVDGAVSTLEGELTSLEGRLTDLIRSLARAAEADAIRAVDLTAVGALTDIWPHLATDVDALIKSIPKELTDIRDEVAAWPRAIPTGLADALSGLGILAIPLLRYLVDCGVPLCRDLHGLADLFNDLWSLTTDAALLGLFTLAATNPHAAANVIVDVIGPVAHGAEAITKDLLGV